MRYLLSTIYPAVNLFYQFRLSMQLFLTTKRMYACIVTTSVLKAFSFSGTFVMPTILR